MARKVFFSFHHNEQNVWKVQQIRNLNALFDTNKFFSNYWEKIKKNGDSAIKKWIDDQLSGRSVTCVLISQHTHTRPWIKYEIEKSMEDVKGILGIYIDSLKDKNGDTHQKGENFLLSKYKVYNPSDYNDTPYKVISQNIEKWVEKAAQDAGK